MEKADALFYAHGYDATSFADLAAEVGISRGNFYHHFKCKDDVLEAVIARRMEKTQAMLATWEANEEPVTRIMAFIRILIENRAMIMAYGCPVGTLSTELAKLEHAAQGRAADIFGLFRNWLAAQFTALGHDAQEADTLSMHLLARSQGIAVMASAFRDETFLRSEVAALEHWLCTTCPQVKGQDKGEVECT